jgi:dethiobiotin synthetase
VRGCFVTGTDTGVGKTVVAAAIVAALRARGVRAHPLKPIITGLDEAPSEGWPHDHEILAAAAGCSSDKVMLTGFGPAVSPHLAVALSGRDIDPADIVSAISAAGQRVDALVVEGVGGLLVPIREGYDVRQLARDVGLPLVIAARPGLGTINHTLLTLEAARAADLAILGVVLTPWPEAPSAIERSNRATIADLGQIPVATLPHLDRADPELLAAAGRLLPLEEWLR